MAPLKPLMNFMFKHFFLFAFVKLSFGSKFIFGMASVKWSSMEFASILQDGGTSFKCARGVSS